MKLTKRGKRARALLILAGLVLAGFAVHFFLTHHREEYNCHPIAEGRECSLRWVHN
jgi:hypothetical protein